VVALVRKRIALFRSQIGEVLEPVRVTGNEGGAGEQLGVLLEASLFAERLGVADDASPVVSLRAEISGLGAKRTANSP
jgi:hypothetical protein